MRKIKRVCVFCGSSPGAQPAYGKAAEQLGRVLVERGIGLVYGGASVGLMGRLAETVLAVGGDVIGVIPSGLAKREVAYEELSDLRVVDSMHERKAMMAELADGFVAMPGGLGTLEEIFEVLTWAQLGIHDKPCGFLNICGYYDTLITFLKNAVAQKFVRAEHRSMMLVNENPEALLDQFVRYRRPDVDKAKWILDLKNT